MNVDKILDLQEGSESGNVALACVLDGCPVTLTVSHLDGWNLVAEWSAIHDGDDLFRLARTFTQKRYAADWIRGHFRSRK